MEIRARKVARLMRRLRAVAPWLEPSDEAACRAYCELDYVGAVIFAAMAKTGEDGVLRTGTTGDLEVRKLVEAHRTNRLAQLAYAKELGLTSASRIAIRATSDRIHTDLAARMVADDDDEPTNDEVTNDG